MSTIMYTVVLLTLVGMAAARCNPERYQAEISFNAEAAETRKQRSNAAVPLTLLPQEKVF